MFPFGQRILSPRVNIFQKLNGKVIKKKNNKDKEMVSSAFLDIIISGGNRGLIPNARNNF